MGDEGVAGDLQVAVNDAVAALTEAGNAAVELGSALASIGYDLGEAEAKRVASLLATVIDGASSTLSAVLGHATGK